jgi:hypothetical protein
MKKLFLLSFIASMCMVTSCINDEDNNASASGTYYAEIDSIRFTDENDTIYTNYITKALQKDQVMYYAFSESSKVNISSIEAAQYLCDEYAVAEITKRAEAVTLNSLKESMYAIYGSKELNQYATYSDIPLEPLTIYYSLYSSNSYDGYSFTNIYHSNIDVK